MVTHEWFGNARCRRIPATVAARAVVARPQLQRWFVESVTSHDNPCTILGRITLLNPRQKPAPSADGPSWNSVAVRAYCSAPAFVSK